MSSTSTVKFFAAWILLAGCAMGASDASDAAVIRFPTDPMPEGGTGGLGGVIAGGGGGAAGTVPMFDGEPCTQGQTQPCACAGVDTMGERMCVADPLSPTGGALSECRNCPAAPDGGMSGGAGGMSGGAGGMSGGASGTSGGASGMSGGAGGMSGGAGGMSGCMCTDALACCKDDGTCGVGAPGFCF